MHKLSFLINSDSSHSKSQGTRSQHYKRIIHQVQMGNKQVCNKTRNQESVNTGLEIYISEKKASRHRNIRL